MTTAVTSSDPRVDAWIEGLRQTGQLEAMLRPLREADAEDREIGRPPHPAGEAEDRLRAEIAQEYIRADVRWSRAPVRFRDARVGDLEGPMREAVDEWNTTTPRRNLLLLGSVGCGKTHAAFAALRERIDQRPRSTWAFWPVVELMDALRPDGDECALQEAMQVDYLVLDDLGAERPTDWTGERLYLLVNRRWMEGQPIIATSNLSAAGGKGPLVEAVGQRLYSRLVHDAIIVQLAGDDRRRARS